MITKSQVFGVDFSGAEDACKKIWICESVVTKEGIKIEDCWNLKSLSGNRKINRNECFKRLKNLIAENKDAAFDLDFPFGLPEIVADEDNWAMFIKNFSEKYNGPEEFRRKCQDRALNLTEMKELRRATDIETESPFCPYNLRLFKQTYYGINNVLRPLVMEESARILPMEDRENSKSWVLEICPASTLKDVNLYLTGYKGKENTSRKHRETILTRLEEMGFVYEIDTKVWKSSVEDEEGDALDCVVAAIATYRGLSSNPILDGTYKLEGYIYV